MEEAVNRSRETHLKEDFFIDAKPYTLSPLLPSVENLLVIHGEKDETVPVEHARRIYEAARKPRKLEIVAGADHVFSNPQHRHRAIDKSVEWFKKYL